MGYEIGTKGLVRSVMIRVGGFVAAVVVVGIVAGSIFQTLQNEIPASSSASWSSSSAAGKPIAFAGTYALAALYGAHLGNSP